MAMKKTHNAVYAGEKYTDKDGNEKTRYITIGVLFQRDDGSLTAKIESVPVGFTGWVNFWEPKEDDGKGQRTGGGNTRGGNPDDSIPFAPIGGIA